jgi:RNA polymerase sigma factor (sigma-70 family)
MQLSEEYMQQIRKYSRLSREREIELSNIILHSDDKNKVDNAIEEFVNGNLLLVVKEAIKYYDRYIRPYGFRSQVSIMDIVAHGNIGLFKAVKSYDANHESESKFSTYAVKCINSEMGKGPFLDDFIRTPRHQFKYKRQLKELIEKYGEDVSDEVLMKEMDITKGMLDLVRNVSVKTTQRLEAIEDWEQLTEDENILSPDEERGRSDLREYLIKKMDKYVTPREKEMLIMFFLSEQQPTYSDLSEKFGVSRERARQICAKGLFKLRRAIYAEVETKDPGKYRDNVHPIQSKFMGQEGGYCRYSWGTQRYYVEQYEEQVRKEQEKNNKIINDFLNTD